MSRDNIEDMIDFKTGRAIYVLQSNQPIRSGVRGDSSLDRLTERDKQHESWAINKCAEKNWK